LIRREGGGEKTWLCAKMPHEVHCTDVAALVKLWFEALPVSQGFCVPGLILIKRIGET
jgi:hypothetical protein